jgi:uncharacterized membrane protein YraQ (UPF0718 family)
VPAFLLAGGMVAFIPKETILRYLGIAANRIRSFIIAAFASFFVAACSCTVIPVSAGVYFAGASIGAAFIILWVAPATNVLALTYTGAIIGWDMASVRILSALLMAIVVGYVMTAFFFRESLTIPVRSRRWVFGGLCWQRSRMHQKCIRLKPSHT